MRQMQGSVVFHPGSSATRNGGTPEPCSAADLTYLQAVVTTMFCPRRLAAAREIEAVEIKLVPSNRRNLIVTIIWLVSAACRSFIRSDESGIPFTPANDPCPTYRSLCT